MTPVPIKNTIALLTISDLLQEANLHRKVTTLRDAGFRVLLFAVRDDRLDMKQWQGIELQRIDLNAKNTLIRFLVFIIRATLWLFKTRADLFIAYDALPLVPLRLKKLLQQCTYIYDSVELFLGINSLYGRPWRRRMWKLYERFGIGGAARSFTVCESDATALKKTYPFISAPGVVRNIPIFMPGQRSDYLRTTFDLDRQTRIGIYQGKIFRGRGLENLIAALPGLPNFVLFIIGDGPIKDELKRTAQELGVERQVRFIDAVPFQELPRFTLSADIGFTIISGQGLSYIHALPNKLFEYIQAGLPLIGSNYPEISRIIDGEGIGITVDPQDTQAIHEAIGQMLDDDVRRGFEKRLVQISGKYTWQKESQEYLRIVRSALEGSQQLADQPVAQQK